VIYNKRPVKWNETDRDVHSVTWLSPSDYAASMAALAESHPEKIKRAGEASWCDQSGQNVSGFLSDVKSGGTVRHADAIRKAAEGVKVPAFRLYGETVALGVGPGVPIIPAVLAGVPEHNLTLDNGVDVSTPLRVVFDRTSSGGLNAGQVERAGAAVAAFVEIAQASRPVEVWVLCNTGADGDSNACSMRLKLSPHASQAELGLYVVGLGAIRRGMYGFASAHHGFFHNWPFRSNDTDSSSIVCSSDLLTDTDIFIGPMHYSHPLIQDPARWIEESLSKAFQGVAERES